MCRQLLDLKPSHHISSTRIDHCILNMFLNISDMLLHLGSIQICIEGTLPLTHHSLRTSLYHRGCNDLHLYLYRGGSHRYTLCISLDPYIYHTW